MEQAETIYYQGRYWNDIPLVAREINRRFTGSPDTDWIAHFSSLTNRVFKKALFINCGNGWVERGFIDRGLIQEAVGLDVSESLLEQARRDAGNRRLRYYARDINLADFVEDGFDLVVNHAAAHHIAFLDRVLRKIARVLAKDGVFVNMDYVGPHRNQYPETQWEEARRTNARLPKAAQAQLVYPHLPTMLVTDPTEAIHSDLVVPTIYKYFEVTHHARAGGAVAYPILTHNDAFWTLDPVERDRVAAEVLAADFSYLQREPQSSMFDYIVASPKGEMTGSRDSEEADERSEIERELHATRNGGYYRSPAWTSGHEIDFRLGSCGGRIFCEGLSFAELHGSWTDGVASRIRFSGPTNRGFRIDFDVAPFLGWNVDHSAQRTVESGNGQRVIVLLNGRHLSSTTVLKAGVLSIVVPKPRLDPTGEYEMNLVLPDAKQCIDSAGKVVDGRHLGILLTRATLVEL